MTINVRRANQYIWLLYNGSQLGWTRERAASRAEPSRDETSSAKLSQPSWASVITYQLAASQRTAAVLPALRLLIGRYDSLSYLPRSVLLNYVCKSLA